MHFVATSKVVAAEVCNKPERDKALTLGSSSART